MLKPGGLANFDYVKVNVPLEIMTQLKARADTIQANPGDQPSWNSELAGHLREQYGLVPGIAALDQWIRDQALWYNRMYNISSTTNLFTHNVNISTGTAWMNFQRATEYNPAHFHNGLLSWVIWIQIPYSRPAEDTVFPDRKPCLNGAFQFLYTDVLGRIATNTIELDSTWEGTMIMFPAQFMHQVYPFYTSNQYRISAAGNVYLDTAALGGHPLIKQG